MTTTLSEEMRPFLVRAAFAGSETVDDSGAALVFRILANATQPEPAEDGEDPRYVEIRDLVMGAAPEVRTRAAQMATALVPILTRLRSLILTVKSESNDSDVAHGDAEVLPGGWLVVRMGDDEIARLPWNPERGAEDAGRVAEEILSEHVRLHIARAPEVVKIPMPDPDPERPIGIRPARKQRLVVQ